jgi:large subunit ribosomal protein L23
MRAKDILIKPILTEKSNNLQDKRNSYVFKVGKAANKLEIKKAVEDFYGIEVAEVNTLRVPAKAKSRYTKAGFVHGFKDGYKKAIVKVAEGQTIDLYQGY